MRLEDIIILKRVIEKEGFEYAMLYYSNYKGSVEFNHIEDETFHELRDKLVSANKALAEYCMDSTGLHIHCAED